MIRKQPRRGRMTARWAALLASALLAVGALGAVGCGNDNPAGPEPETDTPDDEGPAPSRFGIWEVIGGELRVSPDQDLMVRALRLDEDGTARVYFEDQRIGSRSAATGTHTGTVPLLVQLPTVTPGEPTFPALDLALEGNALTLTGPDGNAVTLERRSVLPPGIGPVALPVLERFDGLPTPDPLTDLAADGDLLVYNSMNAVEAFDPTTGAIAPPVTHATDMIVMSRPRPLTNGASHRFWVLRRDKPLELWHRTLTDSPIFLAYDSVSVGGLASFTKIDAVAFQELPLGLSGHLMVHGKRAGSYNMIAVDILSDPHEVDGSDPFDRVVHALEYDSSGLWAVVDSGAPIIALLDPSTVAVRESYAVPDENVAWIGIYITDAGIHLLGTDPGTGSGVIVLLEHP